MTASSISQYLEQRRASKAAGGDPRKEAWAALASRAVAAEAEPAPLRSAPFRSVASPARRPFGIDAPASFAIRRRRARSRRCSSGAKFRRRPFSPISRSGLPKPISAAFRKGSTPRARKRRPPCAGARRRSEARRRRAHRLPDERICEARRDDSAGTEGSRTAHRRLGREEFCKPFLLASVTSRGIDEIVASLARLTERRQPGAD